MWVILWIFVLFSACFLTVLILLFYQWCCYLKVAACSWMVCIFECVCYSVKFYVILWMFTLFSACFCYGIYVVVIPELQRYSLVFFILWLFFTLWLFMSFSECCCLSSKCFCYSLKVCYLLTVNVIIRLLFYSEFLC